MDYCRGGGYYSHASQSNEGASVQIWPGNKEEMEKFTSYSNVIFLTASNLGDNTLVVAVVAKDPYTDQYVATAYDVEGDQTIIKTIRQPKHINDFVLWVSCLSGNCRGSAFVAPS